MKQRILTTLLLLATLTLGAWAEDYGLYINGQQVTSTNCADPTGDGAFRYIPGTKTLMILGDATYTTGNQLINNTTVSSLTIQCDLDVTLHATSGVIQTSQDITVTGTGHLTLISDADCGIYLTSDAKATISITSLDVSGRWGIAGVPHGESLDISVERLYATGTEFAIGDLP